MQRLKSFAEQRAVLYLVATPIGNLSEMTPRAIETLQSVDVIACEDTRNTAKLLSHFQIKQKMIAHHEFNEQQSSQGILEMLQKGMSVALVSDAGYPCISDPGAKLVAEICKHGFPIIPISGASAGINALVASGLSPQPYLFYGFLDSHENERKKQLAALEPMSMTLLFYEAPHRIQKMLESMLTVFGDRQICLARELTKLHEEFIRGSISEVIAVCEGLKGEIVVVVAGKEEKKPAITMHMVETKISDYMSQGMTASEAIKSVAKELDIPKNEVYRYYHQA